VAGTLVLAGALASSRHQRVAEGALLRTLGARRRQVLSVLLAEYLALGMLSTLVGLGLALLASGLLVALGFDIPFRADPRVIGGIWAAVSLLTVVTGLLGSRDLLRRPPLPVLRGE
jgi:putative ABC transport system permease protein